MRDLRALQARSCASRGSAAISRVEIQMCGVRVRHEYLDPRSVPMLVWYLDGPYLTFRCEILDGHLTGCWAADRSTAETARNALDEYKVCSTVPASDHVGIATVAPLWSLVRPRVKRRDQKKTRSNGRRHASRYRPWSAFACDRVSRLHVTNRRVLASTLEYLEYYMNMYM